MEAKKKNAMNRPVEGNKKQTSFFWWQPTLYPQRII